MVRPRIALALAPLALVAGCGGDDEQAEAPPDPPPLTIPRTAPEPAETQATDTAGTTTQDPSTAPLSPGEGDGSTPAPGQTAPDSPQNDTAPPAGSPAERFERQCEENPAACG